MSGATRTYRIEFAEQNKDGIVEAADMIAYLQATMKVRNSKVVASRELKFKNSETAVEVICKEGSVLKPDMKQYVRRFLRNKTLRAYIRIRGDGTDKIFMEYINPVCEDAEEEQ